MFTASTIIGRFNIYKPFSAEEEELFKSVQYGKKVNVNGHTMNYEIFGENNSPTIVYLPGCNTLAPACEFKPYAEELSEKYRVVVIEPFGYGLSDIIDDERTIENITLELHTAIKAIGLDKYYLMAHSIGGLYSLYISNQYPDEVLGFIGIDPTVPNQQEVAKQWNLPLQTVFKIFMCMIRGFDQLKLMDRMEKDDPYKQLPILKDYNYSKEELEALRICKRRNNNKTIYNEICSLEDNLQKVVDMKFPENVPVLNLIAFDKGKHNELWKKLHEDVITETVRSKVVVLEGTHMLHFDNKKEFIKQVKEWIN